ncbi:MAG TPA: hypothetical protein VEL07_16745 [Planctomycetota bacterium]|nr:hypothetical protein [Planctomycetota bacterium]
MRPMALPVLAALLALTSGCGVTRSIWEEDPPRPPLSTLHAEPPVGGPGERIHLRIIGRYGDLRDDAAVVDLTLRRIGDDDEPLAACTAVALRTCGSPPLERADLWLVDFTHADGRVSTWRVLAAESIPGPTPTPSAESLPVAHTGDRLSARHVRTMDVATRVAVTPIAVAADIGAYAVVGAIIISPSVILALAEAEGRIKPCR